MRAIRVTALRLLLAILCWVGPATLSGCSVHEHNVGLGPNGLGTESVRQFYILFGWLQINEVDSQRLAKDATSYRICSEWSFVDVLLAPFLLPLTVTSRTVTVER